MQTQIDTIHSGTLLSAVNDTLDHLDRAADSLPFLVSLTSERRQSSSGKLKTDEEAAIDAVLTTVEKHPGPFASLNVEPAKVREAMSRRALLQRVAERARQFSERVADTVLHVGETIKEPSSRAYHVASALARHDLEVANDLQPAQQFYQRFGRSAARSRKANAR